MKVDWAIPCMAAHSTGDGVGMLGGGFDSISFPDDPPWVYRLIIAMSFVLQWRDLNTEQRFWIDIENEDGEQCGRADLMLPAVLPPPTHKPGQTTRYNKTWQNNITINGPCTLTVIVTPDNPDVLELQQESTYRTSFKVVSSQSSRLELPGDPGWNTDALPPPPGGSA